MSDAKDNTGHAAYERYIADLERDEDEIATIKARNAAECQKVLARRKTRMKQAKAEGLSVQVLGALLGVRKAQRKAAELIEELEEDVRDDFDMVFEGMDDLPLFGKHNADVEAKKAEREKKSAAKVDEQRSRLQALSGLGEADKQAADNVVALERGIQPLN